MRSAVILTVVVVAGVSLVLEVSYYSRPVERENILCKGTKMKMIWRQNFPACVYVRATSIFVIVRYVKLKFREHKGAARIASHSAYARAGVWRGHGKGPVQSQGLERKDWSRKSELR